MFDAYTVKKVLPRLFAAVILIQLSWFLFTGVIKAVNLVAYGIEGLIYAPFGGIENLQLGDILSQTGGGVGLGFSGIVIGAGAVVVGAIAVGGILATAMIALLGILIAFALLLFRQVMIIGLLVVAPLALVAWILPSTEKYWKLWWDSFFKLLLVYPIILGMVAIGRVFAYIIAGVNPGGTFPAADDIVTFLMIMAAVIGPFYLIPKTFQMAGGAFASLTGAINNKGAGAFDRLKKRRSQTRAENWQNTKAGSRFSERNAFTRRVNRIGQGVGVGARGRFGLGDRGEQAVDLASQVSADEALKNNPALQKLAFHDDGNAVMALSGGSRRGAEQAANQLMQGWMDANPELTLDDAIVRRDNALEAASAVGLSRQNAQGAFSTLPQNKSRSVGAGQRQIIEDGIDRLAGGNAQQAENLRDSFSFHSSGNGRGDLGATDWNSDTASLDGFGRAGLYQTANGHQHAITAAGNDAAGLLTTGNREDAARASTFYHELGAMLPNATGPVRDEIIQQRARLQGAMDSQLLAPGGGPQTEDRRVAYDNTDPAHAAWSPSDRVRGWRNEAQTVTIGDLGRRQARSYERPDPNNIP